MHPRTEIRARFLALINSISAFNTNVFESRVYPIAADKLPVALVYTSTETNTPLGYDFTQELTREITLNIEILSNGGDLEIDGLCELVETVISADSWLQQVPISCYLANTNIELSGSGEKARVTATLRYQITLLSNENPTI